MEASQNDKVCGKCFVLKTAREYIHFDASVCAVCMVQTARDLRDISKAFTCPCCNAALTASYELKVKVIPNVGSTAPPAPIVAKPVASVAISNQEQQLALMQAEVLNLVKTTGLFNVFELTVKEAKPAGIPKNLDEFFLHFLKNASPYKLPLYSKALLAKEYPGTTIGASQWNEIVAIVVDKKLRSFIPLALIEGRKIHTIGLSAKIDADAGQFVDWVRTKFGYVVGKGHLFNELQQKSAGGFAKASNL